MTEVAGRVIRLRIAPVKGLALREREWIDLGPRGVDGDRRFFLVGPDGQHRSGAAFGPLVRITPDYDPAAERLTLRFPDGQVVDLDASPGGQPFEVPWPYGDSPITAQHVPGADAALSAYMGLPVRLVRMTADSRISSAAVTILSVASVQAIERGTDQPASIDDRRFRMLVTIDGVAPFAEDVWLGREVRIGGAVVRVDEATARCVITTRDPSTGERDLDMLRLIKDIRGHSAGQTIDLGVYASVVTPGRIAVGDIVQPLETAAVTG